MYSCTEVPLINLSIVLILASPGDPKTHRISLVAVNCFMTSTNFGQILAKGLYGFIVCFDHKHRFGAKISISKWLSICRVTQHLVRPKDVLFVTLPAC